MGKGRQQFTSALNFYVDQKDLAIMIDMSKGFFSLQSQLASTRLQLKDMAIEVFNDTSGIDAEKSSNIVYDDVNKSYKRQNPDTKLLNGTVVANGNSSTHLPAHAFDGSLNSYWQSNSNWSGETVIRNVYNGKDFGEGANIQLGKIGIAQQVTSYSVPAIVVQGLAADGVTWEDIQEITGIPLTVGYKYYDIYSDKKYRGFRIMPTAGTNGGNGYQWIVHELEFYEKVPLNAILTLKAVDSGVTPYNMYVVADKVLNHGAITYRISRDGGVTFSDIAEEKLVDIATTPAGHNVVLEVSIAEDAELKAVAWGWK
jgi:hypothetical protein